MDRGVWRATVHRVTNEFDIRTWQPTPVFFLESPMDRGVWWATVHRVTNESDMIYRLKNNTVHNATGRSGINNDCHEHCRMAEMPPASWVTLWSLPQLLPHRAAVKLQPGLTLGVWPRDSAREMEKFSPSSQKTMG